MGSNDKRENLLCCGGLKVEPPDRKECEGLLCSAIDRLQDAHNPALSFASCFDLAYNAPTRCLCLQGYRSDRRYMAEYDGYMEGDEPLLAEKKLNSLSGMAWPLHLYGFQGCMKKACRFSN